MCVCVSVCVVTWVWVNRRALKQDGGGPIAQRAVHNVAVSCYPANVGHTAEHVAILVVKHILEHTRTHSHGYSAVSHEALQATPPLGGGTTTVQTSNAYKVTTLMTSQGAKQPAHSPL